MPSGYFVLILSVETLDTIENKGSGVGLCSVDQLKLEQ